MRKVLVGAALIMSPVIAGCVLAYLPGTVTDLATRPVARDALVTGDSERSGYGAYSYILFRRRPWDSRGQALLRAYLRHPGVADVGYGDRSPGSRNITYLPVDGSPPMDAPDDANWYAEHYDVARAEALLRSQRLSGLGPYVVTSTKPLTTSTEPATGASVLDLSDLRTDQQAAGWMEQFVETSDRADSWLPNGAAQLALQMRDSLNAGVAQSVIEDLSDGRKLLKPM